MIPLRIVLDSEQATDFVNHERLVAQGDLTGIGLLRHGTVGGKATVSMVVTLRNGDEVFAETTWALFRTAYTAMAASAIVAEEVIEP